MFVELTNICKRRNHWRIEKHWMFRETERTFKRIWIYMSREELLPNPTEGASDLTDQTAKEASNHKQYIIIYISRITMTRTKQVYIKLKNVIVSVSEKTFEIKNIWVSGRENLNISECVFLRTERDNKIWSWVLWKFDTRVTALVKPRCNSTSKLQTTSRQIGCPHIKKTQ
jgi:hypothetical protein